MAAASPRSDDDARRAASLRRVAIVLKNLPRPVAAKLLGELPVESQQRLQYEVASLDEVDPLEHKRALESFAGSMRQSQPVGSNRGNAGNPVDEIVFSRTASDRNNQAPTRSPVENHSAGGTYAAPAPSANQSFDFMDALSNDDVRGLLQSEHPQTIAVVMASIDPRKAAAILPQFPPRERQDILSRIGRLQEFPDSMIEDLASTFRSKAEALIARSRANPLQDLINAYAPSEGWDPAQAARHVPTEAAAVSPRLKAILSEMTPAQESAPPNTANHSARPLDANPSAHPATTPVGPTAVNQADPNPSAHTLRVHHPGETSNEPNDASQSANTVPATSGLSTDDVHQRLIKMKPRLLCEALGRVPTRTAMLCLCGLPNKTADSAISMLPRQQANQVRSQLASVGSMELREIDEAKEAVLIASAEPSTTAMAA
ncbi:FliG C-terminal domain-containing protein [Rhodopirellula bahusiensis]|uniref:Flagellar motor switch protein FliG n=1 Tax=Rhodopirellula bahusiensis TaxID=2014065 RepID=A0A2G1W353_9BACT|nr:FliG C-terminal domain-containing protein [Rhodopirellula bahusiensis]PHQ33454.1 flagellar motor switch protein FliG [Rhodopirellula bahusiensis]